MLTVQTLLNLPGVIVSSHEFRGMLVSFGAPGEVDRCTATDPNAIGVVSAEVESNEPAKLYPLIPGTVVPMLTAGVVALNVPVYQANDGKINDSGTIQRGISLQEATAADQVIEVLVQ